MKKRNNLKLGLTLLAIVVVIGGYFAVNNFLGGSKGDKTIVITIKDDSNNKVIMDKKKFKTDAVNLGDFLAENKEELKLDMPDSQYGRFVSGLMDIKTTDMTKGPWWMYSYKSPSQGLDMKLGEAPGVDTLGLHDKDEVEFTFTNNTGM
jgi:hypothetical protein